MYSDGTDLQFLLSLDILFLNLYPGEPCGIEFLTPAFMEVVRTKSNADVVKAKDMGWIRLILRFRRCPPSLIGLGLLRLADTRHGSTEFHVGNQAGNGAECTDEHKQFQCR